MMNAILPTFAACHWFHPILSGKVLGRLRGGVGVSWPGWGVGEHGLRREWPKHFSQRRNNSTCHRCRYNCAIVAACQLPCASSDRNCPINVSNNRKHFPHGCPTPPIMPATIRGAGTFA